jgi:formylglycine-generating enzyme required for sulfatase activity
MNSRRLVGLAVLVGCVLSAAAQELVIQSLEASGRITFSETSDATSYRVEWAPSPSGPWTNFTGTYGGWLDSIPATGSGSVTASVPMVYRVVAVSSVPDEFLLIDLSGGVEATNYPASTILGVPSGGWTEEHRTTKLVLRRIPAGTFTMGSPAGELGRYSDEIEHQVTLTRDFYIGVFEVTQEQWYRVMGDWLSYFNNESYRASRPVEQASYDDIRGATAGAGWPGSAAVDAGSFIGRLRSKTGLTTLDLPTESQWEYACRAGTTTALNSGNNLTDLLECPNMGEVGRYTYNGGSDARQGGTPAVGTARVGSYLPSQWGLYDMHGNVWEWCLDWYGTYPETVVDPDGAASGSLRVMRGGSWGSNARSCRSALRNDYVTSYRNYVIGFRITRTLP